MSSPAAIDTMRGSEAPTPDVRRGAVDAAGSPDGRPQPGGGMKFTYASGEKPLAGFTIKRGIGVGGFGEVYYALSDAGKEVALKRVQRNLDIELRGVSHCLNLKHPHLVSLFDVRYDDGGGAWVVMEYVAGDSLRTVLDGAPTGIGHDETRRWFSALAAGVSHLHEAGIVHRDLKPGNLFDDDGIIKIGDYGLSKFISCSRRGGHTESVGTFHYMAPEVGRGQYGREIDIYALGIILYEMLTGRVPFDGESSHEIVMKHLTATPDLAGIPEPYRAVIGQALQKNPTARQSTIAQLVRPLGVEIDPQGLPRALATSASRPTAGTSPHAATETAGGPPVGAESYAEKARCQGEPAGSGATGAAVAASGGALAVASRQEPLARSFRSLLASGGRWWESLEAFPGTRILVMLLGVGLLLFNVQWLLPLLSFFAILYIPYYIIRAMILSVSPQPSFAEAHLVAVARSQQPRPPSVKQWRERKRVELAAKPTLVRADELLGSMSRATFAAVILAAGAGLVGLWHAEPTSLASVPFAWSATVAALGAAAVLILSKLWERDPGHRMPRRLALLGAGAAVGAAAFVLANFLMLPIGDNVARDIDVTPLPVALYDSDGTPTIAAMMAHFAVLFAGLRWWRTADPLRRSRLSIWSIAVAVVAQWGLHQVLPVPQPWGMLVAGVLAAAVQIAAPWENPRERFREPEPIDAKLV